MKRGANGIQVKKGYEGKVSLDKASYKCGVHIKINVNVSDY